MSDETPIPRPSVKHYFVDEAGDPVLFDSKGVNVNDTREAEYGAYYTKQKPLKAAALKNG
jgi:hypothetical protein